MSTPTLEKSALIIDMTCGSASSLFNALLQLFALNDVPVRSNFSALPGIEKGRGATPTFRYDEVVVDFDSEVLIENALIGINWVVVLVEGESFGVNSDNDVYVTCRRFAKIVDAMTQVSGKSVRMILVSQKSSAVSQAICDIAAIYRSQGLPTSVASARTYVQVSEERGEGALHEHSTNLEEHSLAQKIFNALSSRSEFPCYI